MGSHGRRGSPKKKWCLFATLEQVANKAARAVRDQHRAWLGDISNPARQIGCLADHRLAGIPAVATRAHEPNSGGDTRPNVCGGTLRTAGADMSPAPPPPRGGRQGS